MTADIGARRAAAAAHPAAIPSDGPRRQSFSAQLRSKTVEKAGKTFSELEGYASVVERGYEMWDMFGEYVEVIDRGAFDQTLERGPDVSFLVNHGGLTMARTTAGTLTLSADETGLLSSATLNPQRQDVADLLHAIDDGSITEMSFAFRITDGQWSPDYTEYRIKAVDLERGDVSAVNYGANPFTSISARAKQAFEAIDGLEGAALRAAFDRLSARLAVAEPAEMSSGPSLATLRARLEVDAA